MLVKAVAIQFGLHVAVASLAFLLGRSQAQDGQHDDAVWLLPLLVVALVAAAALGSWVGRRRREAYGRERAARRAAEARIVHLSRHDALTGLLNRTVFVEHLEQVVCGGRRGERSAAVLCVDLMDFKAINDTLGHAAGDLLLRHTGARLLASLRETDVLARMSGDEFAIIQSGLDGPKAAARLCERLLDSMEEPFDLFGQTVYVGASIGVAMYPSDERDPEVLLKQASLALHRAKAGGGKSFRFFEDGMDAEVRERKALEQDLHQALQRGELELHYQPQIDLATRHMVGVEALLRWNHPTRGRIGPDLFIPIAEDCGLILPIGAWVLEQACAQGVRWQAAGARELRMSVNLSPVQFRHADLAGLVADTLRRTGLVPRLLELEITERALMDHTESNLATLRQLGALGVRISIDDFGVGHSSFAYLQRFPFDEIKVDRSFVSRLEHDRSAAAIVRATLSLGQSLGMEAVAEGVETAGQLDLLRADGCRIAQGYYFSPPVCPAEIDIMVEAAALATHESEVEELRATG